MTYLMSRMTYLTNTHKWFCKFQVEVTFLQIGLEKNFVQPHFKGTTFCFVERENHIK